jgi:hypothetical protein
MEGGGGGVEGDVAGTSTEARGRGKGRGRCREPLQFQENCSAKDGVGQGRAVNLVAAHVAANCSAKLETGLDTVASSCTVVDFGRVGTPGRRGEGSSGAETGRERQGAGGGGRGIVETMGDDGRRGACTTSGDWVSGSTSMDILPSLSSRSCGGRGIVETMGDDG